LYATEPATVNPPKALERSASLAYPAAVVVFSGLLDCGHGAIRTWFALRAVDTKGQGWVDFKIADLANWMGCDRSTIYRHLSNKVFFPQVMKYAGKVRVFLKSVAKVAADLGFDTVKSLGACAEFDPKWLGKHMLSVTYGTELEVQNGQRQAYRTAIYSSKGAQREKIVDPNFAAIAHSKKEDKLRKARDKRRQELGRSVVVQGFKPRSYRMFRIRFDQLVPGVTQEEIGKRLGRSTRTIKRRLNNTTRIRYGIAPLNRRRVIQELAPDVEKRFADYLNHMNLDFASVKYGNLVIQIGRFKVGEEKVRIYRLLTNAYDFNENAFTLLSARCARARTKRLLKRIKEQRLPR
jgi:hypothetical protein